MSTVVRPELSKSNALYISKHRYYELKHFCLQYPEWQKKCRYLKTSSVIKPTDNSNEPDWIFYKEQIDLVEDCIKNAADEWLQPFLKRSVVLGESYTRLRDIDGCPCCKEIFYNAYRRFFYILSERR